MSASSLPVTVIEAGALKWWIAVDGEPRGPYTEAYVRRTLEANRLSPDALLCPVNGHEWKSASEWPTFHGFKSTSAAVPPPPLRATVHSDPVGVMLRCIGLYATIIAPALFLLNVAAALTGNSYSSQLPAGSMIIGHAFMLDLFGFLMGLGMTTCLAIGGWRLLTKVPSGLNWTMWTLAISDVLGVVMLPTLVVWWALIELHAPETANQPTASWHTFINFLLLAGFLFEVVALIWLVLNRQLIAARLRHGT